MVNAYNYYSRLSRSGTVTQSGSDPNVQLQVMNTNYNIGQLYASQRLQDNYSFTISFEMWNDSSAGGFGPGDGLSFFFGSTSATPGILSANNQYSLEIYMYQYNGGVPRGMHLYKNGTRVVTNTTTTWLSASTWYPFSITFTRSPNNTVSISFNGSVLYTYSDPNVETWWASSGVYYGFGTANGAATTNTYIRKFTLTPTPPLSGALARKSFFTLAEVCFLNKVSTITRSNCTAAYSIRLLLASYTGPMVSVRRGSDNATADFYGDLNGQLGTGYLGTGTSLTSWLSGATGFVVTWYDQSGYERDLTQSTGTAQPTIASGSTGTNITFDGSADFMTTTSVPLTSGLKTYTYMANWTCTGNTSNNGVICEQNNTNLTSSQRASILVAGGSYKYGFNGESNDSMNLVPFALNTQRRTVMVCNHNLSTGNIRLYDNGICYSGTTGTPSSLSLATNVFTVGKKSTGSSEFFQGTINEVIVIANTIQDREALLYFTPTAISRSKFGFPKPRLQLTFHPNTNSPLPNNHGAVANCVLDLSLLQAQSNGSAVSGWNGFAQATGSNQPTFYNRGGFRNDMGYVAFNRSNSQHLNGGSKTFNIAANGGFTAVALVQFTSDGSAGSYERIFDFGNGSPSDNIILNRSGTSSSITFVFYNGSTGYGITSATSTIVQNEWAVYTARYQYSTNYYEILKNGVVLVSGTTGAAIPNKTLSNTYVGRSNWSGDAYFSGYIGGLYVYDRFLSNTELSAVTNAMIMNSMPQTIPQHLSEYTNVYISDKIVSVPLRTGFAGYFPGEAGSFVDIQDVPSPPMSYSFWFYTTSSSYQTVLGLCDWAKNGYGMQFDWAPNTLSILAANASNSYSSVASFSISINTWAHITVTINSNFVITAYLNGGSASSLTPSVLPTARSRLVIGASGDGARGYQGFIYDFRIYDYVLRADEILKVYDGVTMHQLTNSLSPTNYLVSCNNWYNVMTSVHNSTVGTITQSNNFSGTYTTVTSGNDPNVQAQTSASGQTSAYNAYYHQYRIQDFATFTCSFEIFSNSASADQMFFVVGATGLPTYDLNTNGGVVVNLQVYSSNGNAAPGVSLMYGGSNVAQSYLTNWLGSGVWTPVTVTYTRATVNTWVVNVGGQDVITYHDTNNAGWIASSSNYWGLGSWTGGATMNAYIRRVELSYTPYTQSNSALSGATVNSLQKFPEAALSANSSLNCVASSSSVFSGAQNYLPWKAFNNTFDSESIFASADYTYNTTSGAYTGSVSTTVSGTSYAGEWVQIQLPYAIRATQYSVTCRPGYETTQSPNTWVFAGSNDGSTWTLLDAQNNVSNWSSSTQTQTYSMKSTSSSFSYYRMICTVTGNVANAIRRIFIVCELQIYGYPFVGIKYPITALTANTQTVSGAGPGTGTYTLTYSSTWEFGGDYTGWNAFNNNSTGTPYHVASNNSNGFYNVAGYTGSTTTTISGTSYSGEWLQIQLPNPIVLSFYDLFPRESNASTQSCKVWYLGGSNDGSTWTLVDSRSGVSSWTANVPQRFTTASLVPYSFYRLVCNQTNTNVNGNSWALGEWCLYDATMSPKIISYNTSPLPGLIEGLTWKYFDTAGGVFGPDTLNYRNIGRTTDMSGLNTATSGQYYQNWNDNYSIEWTGYFRANITGTYTFEVYSDDDTWVWLGSTALAGYTGSNYFIYENAGHVGTRINTIYLIAGVFYPLRMRFQEGGGSDYTNLAFTPPNGTKTNNGNGYFFTSTGTNAAFPAESAKVIKDLTGTNTDGVYYINVNGNSTATYCLMSDLYAGGGWMMLMKATRGTTFGYSSNYWTSANTLNPTQTNRNDGDAKFDAFNYMNIKDVMAIFPDVPSASYTNVMGRNGGSLNLPDGWCWKVENWNGSSRTTALSGFQSSRDSHPANPYVFSGFSSSVFSSQTPAYRHVFGGGSHVGTTNSLVRWGFLMNENGANDFASCDIAGGIGLNWNNSVTYSAGDYFSCCGTAGLNRTMRVEMYGR